MVAHGRMDTGRVTRIGMMGALAALLSYFPEIPLFTEFYKLDFSYVPILMTGYALGFWPGFAVLVIKNLFKLLITTSAGIGEIADVLAGVSMLMPATLVYGRMRTRNGALIGMGIGTVMMIIVGVLANRFILLPFYLGDGFAAYMESHPGFLWVATAPFNLVKGAAVSVATFFLYRPLAPFLKRGLKG